jgi:hypothetical protein
MPFTKGILYPQWFSDTRSRVTIRINLLEEGSVNYDPAVDKYLNKLLLLNVKGRTMAIAIVGTS